MRQDQYQEGFESDPTKLVDLYYDLMVMIGQDFNELGERARHITEEENLKIENFFKTKEEVSEEFTTALVTDIAKRNDAILKLKKLALDIRNFKKNKLGGVWN